VVLGKRSSRALNPVPGFTGAFLVDAEGFRGPVGGSLEKELRGTKPARSGWTPDGAAEGGGRSRDKGARERLPRGSAGGCRACEGLISWKSASIPLGVSS
jgi:hypothetical protein